MDAPLTTTYFGHRIRIEPSEWGYLAHILQETTGRRFIAANSSAMQALDAAFEMIDENLDGARQSHEDGQSLAA